MINPTDRDKNWQKESARTWRYVFTKSNGMLIHVCYSTVNRIIQYLKFKGLRRKKESIKTIKPISGKIERHNRSEIPVNVLKRVSFLSFIIQNFSGFLSGRIIYFDALNGLQMPCISTSFSTCNRDVLVMRSHQEEF